MEQISEWLNRHCGADVQKYLVDPSNVNFTERKFYETKTIFAEFTTTMGVINRNDMIHIGQNGLDLDGFLWQNNSTYLKEKLRLRKDLFQAFLQWARFGLQVILFPIIKYFVK